MKAIDILKSKGFTDAQLELMDSRNLNSIAKKLEPNWKPEVQRIEVKTLTFDEGKKSEKKVQSLSFSFNGYKSVAKILNDGETLTDEGRQVLTAELIEIANTAADMASALSSK
jgi:hypothetical protein